MTVTVKGSESIRSGSREEAPVPLPGVMVDAAEVPKGVPAVAAVLDGVRAAPVGRAAAALSGVELGTTPAAAAADADTAAAWTPVPCCRCFSSRCCASSPLSCPASGAFGTWAFGSGVSDFSDGCPDGRSCAISVRHR